ncbi:unnamed protein product [Prunus brigantina]
MGEEKHYWLLKTEPGEWSWEDQAANGGVTKWDGVKNKQAQKNLKSMKLGDLCFFYHSGAKARRVVGVVTVVREWYSDGGDDGVVDVKAVGEMRRPVDLKEMKGEKGLKGFALFRQPRLSVVPVPEDVWIRVCDLGGGYQGDGIVLESHDSDGESGVRADMVDVKGSWGNEEGSGGDEKKIKLTEWTGWRNRSITVYLVQSKAETMPSKLLHLFSMLTCLGKEGRDAEIESSYYKNLSKLFEDLIASCDGTSHPIHCYSADDLIRATNYLHPSRIACPMTHGAMRMVLSRAVRDIVISIQMSNHENVLKLLGCCLEFPVSALVLEKAAKGVLKVKGDGSLRGDGSLLLPWKIRLRIAKQLASAVTYLHTALPSPVVHRDLKPGCIFLDHDYVPKLSNFSLSITIPPTSGRISEKTDLCSFGVLLLVFLTGRRAWLIKPQEGGYSSVIDYMKSHAYQLQAIVDPKILEEVGGNEQVEQQLHDFLELALSCTQDEIEGRPYMSNVARELVRIDESILPS